MESDARHQIWPTAPWAPTHAPCTLCSSLDVAPPGMQFTSVGIFHLLKAVGWPMSLNDVCVFVPAWFGVSASLLTGLLAHEASGSASAGAFGALVMAVMPAHLMRSIGGGYDNESIAVTAMCLTFYVWCRSLRSRGPWWSIAAGVAYIYMVAAWGGYVFVLNMIGFHAGVLTLLGRLTPRLYTSYTLFYVIGTLGAIQFPFVGMQPFKSMEQLGALLVFCAIQVITLVETLVQRRRYSRSEAWSFRLRCAMLAAAAGLAVIIALIPTGYFGPLSMRVRSLFIKHTRTGNPLVDSVAEHQPTSADAYWHHLHYGCYAAPLGFVILLFGGRGDAKVFMVLYALIAYYFANKMNRLIILMGPVASALSGVALGCTLDWTVACVLDVLCGYTIVEPAAAAAATPSAPPTPAPSAPATPLKAVSATGKKAGKGGSGQGVSASAVAKKLATPVTPHSLWEDAVAQPVRKLMALPWMRTLQACVGVAMLATAPPKARESWTFAQMFAAQMSQPSVVFKARLNTGQVVTVTDYMDAYHWLRDNTAEDARVLAWWDYGYQITGIGERTSLADGNTWNLEHIALLGRCLTSPEAKGHKIIRHLADYVLVWAGGGGDDLAKSPHMARIGTSVFTDICGKHDPMCQSFGFMGDMRSPTPMMANSLLFKMTMNNVMPDVQVNSTFYEEVFTSTYQKVRIYKVNKVSQASKAWVADPANRICDPPGSWQCSGQYPPAIQSMLPDKMIRKAPQAKK